MKSFSTLLAVAALTGCAGASGMSYSFQRTIPKNASIVQLHSSLAPRDLFARAAALLAEQGYSFVHIDSSVLTLDTDGTPVGSSRTPLRVAVRVQADEPGSVLEATGQTLFGPGAWAAAVNSNDVKAKRGFQEMTLLLGHLPNREISYSAN